MYHARFSQRLIQAKTVNIEKILRNLLSDAPEKSHKSLRHLIKSLPHKAKNRQIKFNWDTTLCVLLFNQLIIQNGFHYPKWFQVLQVRLIIPYRNSFLYAARKDHAKMRCMRPFFTTLNRIGCRTLLLVNSPRYTLDKLSPLVSHSLNDRTWNKILHLGPDSFRNLHTD